MTNSSFDKVFVNLNAPDSFQLLSKITGESNANFNYIYQETKAKCQLRGRGSGFIENGTESNEMLHILIEFTDFKSHNEAKTLAKNLIETVQQDLQVYLQTNPQNIIQQTTQQQQPQLTMMPQAVQSFSVPPPTIIQQQPTQVVQQQNFIPQQIIQQNVPMQIIQQTPTLRAAAPIVQFQSQPILQGTNASGQQILFNQPTQQYQLQYVQQPNPQQLQTIQHIIQPTQSMQPIQGIIQSNPNEQQFITVQGNASYMIPPPIIQQAPPQVFNSTSQQTISVNPEDIKPDSMKPKSNDVNNELKTNITQQQAMSRIVTNIPPPSVLTCPPPQVFHQQQVASQQPIQQFILNAPNWPQQQQIQSLPLNSQIQIVAQPQTTLRSGNEILIQQNPQQVIATFNPQQTSASHQQFQQIQVQQAAISQASSSGVQPSQISQIVQVSSHQPMTFQQQFEMKINASENPLQQQQQQQQLLGKRKYEGDNDNNDESSAFPKTGMGINNQNNLTTTMKNKNRVSTSSQQQNPSSSSHQLIRVASSTGSSVVRKNHQKSIYRNSNSSVIVSTTSNNALKSINTSSTAETKTIIKPSPGSLNENLIGNNSTIQFYPQQNQQNQMGFIMRGGSNTQSSRFQSPQNFIHQQFPPPINHNNAQFNTAGPRGQIMSNASIGMYQTSAPTQVQIMQPPPSPHTIQNSVNQVQHQFIQQQQQQQQQQSNTANIYQQNNNFLSNPSLGTFNTMTTTTNAQQQQQQQSGMLSAGNHQQQQPRFRQW